MINAAISPVLGCVCKVEFCALLDTRRRSGYVPTLSDESRSGEDLDGGVQGVARRRTTRGWSAVHTHDRAKTEVPLHLPEHVAQFAIFEICEVANTGVGRITAI
jgi:hypothetical protein